LYARLEAIASSIAKRICIMGLAFHARKGIFVILDVFAMQQICLELPSQRL